MEQQGAFRPVAPPAAGTNVPVAAPASESLVEGGESSNKKRKAQEAASATDQKTKKTKGRPPRKPNWTYKETAKLLEVMEDVRVSCPYTFETKPFWREVAKRLPVKTGIERRRTACKAQFLKVRTNKLQKSIGTEEQRQDLYATCRQLDKMAATKGFHVGSSEFGKENSSGNKSDSSSEPDDVDKDNDSEDDGSDSESEDDNDSGGNDDGNGGGSGRRKKKTRNKKKGTKREAVHEPSRRQVEDRALAQVQAGASQVIDLAKDIRSSFFNGNNGQGLNQPSEQRLKKVEATVTELKGDVQQVKGDMQALNRQVGQMNGRLGEFLSHLEQNKK